MNAITLDCQGLACPGPVLRCMDCLEKQAPQGLTVLVNDPAALENVSRLLTGKGFSVSSLHELGIWTIRANRDASATAASAAAPAPAGGDACASVVPGAQGKRSTTVFITAETIGKGDEELGGKLMLNFLLTLPELGDKLWRIVLVNGGVKLACEGHPCLEKLVTLAESGVSVLVCGTCLGFFGLMEKKRVGETTNMLDVVTSLDVAGKVIQV
ncbi:MAG: sulfurtransferase-like selenium metabolism protein YedF [Humidesulfovibrio sp.]|nr:sulfurtransferase-like selenium metabolism protein YedF [Humidesulfovibrio sp.]